MLTGAPLVGLGPAAVLRLRPILRLQPSPLRRRRRRRPVRTKWYRGLRALRQGHRRVCARLVGQELVEAAGPRVALRQERRQVEEVLEGGRDARVLPPAMAVVRAFENNRKLARLRSNRESSSVLLRRVGRTCRLLNHGALLDPGRDGEGCRAHAKASEVKGLGREAGDVAGGLVGGDALAGRDDVIVLRRSREVKSCRRG